MSNENPYASKPETNVNPYDGIQDPAAQYSAQNQYAQQQHLQSPPPSSDNNQYGEPAYTQAHPNTSNPYIAGENTHRTSPSPQYSTSYGSETNATNAPYGPRSYPQGPAYGGAYGVDTSRGESYALISWVVGLIGFFFGLGFFTGIASIILAHKANKLGVNAAAGKIIGWVSVILYTLAFIAAVAFFIFVVAASQRAI